MAETYYPPLSSIVALEDLPPQLDFLSGSASLQSLFNTIFFRGLQYSINARGDEGFFSLTLIAYQRIGIELPELRIGEGDDTPENRFAIYLNPSESDYPINTLPDPGDPDDPNAPGEDEDEYLSEIPLAVEYRWGVLRFLDDFNYETFLGDIKGLYNLAVQKMEIDPEALVAEAIGTFTQAVGPTDPVEQFIEDVKASFVELAPVTIAVPIGTLQEKIAAIIPIIEDNVRKPILEIIYEVYLKDVGSQAESIIKGRVNELFGSLMEGASVVDYLQDILIPDIDATLGVGIEVEFPRNVLKPVNHWNRVVNGKSKIKLVGGRFHFSTKGDISYENPQYLYFKRSEIGDTGFVISVSGARLDLSRTQNIPEIAGDGRTPDFVGVYVENATISFPVAWQNTSPLDPGHADRAEISGEGLIIGTGGISGTISLREAAGEHGEKTLKFLIGGINVEIMTLSVTFRQNSIIASSITGVLQIPALTANGTTTSVQVQASVSNNGFSVTGIIEEPEGLPIAIQALGEDILTVRLKELSLGETGGRWFIGGAGTLEIGTLPIIGKFLAQKIEVKKFVIWSNGEIDFEGGSLTLPTSVSLNIGPVDLSVTAIHIGSHHALHQGIDRRYKYIGFDGGMKTGVGGVDARGEGIKFFFTVDDDPGNGRPHHSYLRIETLRVDMKIPGDATPETAAALLNGYLSMQSLPEGSTAPGAQEYAGQVQISLPKLGVAGGAGMRLIPSTGAFLVDMNLELSTPILLGATGLGIYGFRGLLGNNYVVDRGPSESWWEYYTKPKRGINLEKLAPAPGFTLGAGVSLATAADSGYIFSSKLFFMLSLPELFMLEGQAAILSNRIGLDTTHDPPFYAAIFITDEGVKAGFGVNYKIPDGSGDIVEVDARMEMAFFFGRASAWHINIGKDQPETDRVQALVLRLAKMYYYLMLSSSGIKAGAGASWKIEKDFSIARIGIGASIDLGAQLSFKPVQIGGFIKLWGYAEFKICGFGVRLELSARLAAEAPQPFIITGSFKVSVGLPWPIPDINVNLSLTWKFREGLDLREANMLVPIENPYGSLDQYKADTKQPAKALHMVTKEPFMLNLLNVAEGGGGTPPPPGHASWVGSFDQFIIPLDSYIDVEFLKGITFSRDNWESKPIAPITEEHSWVEFIPPQKGHSAQVKHEYIVEDIKIWFWNTVHGAWELYVQEDYNTPLIDLIAEEGTMARSQARAKVADHAWLGFWQLTESGKITKLRILGRTPLEHAAGVSNTDLGFPAASIFCAPQPAEKICQNWLGHLPGSPVAANTVVTDRLLRYTISNQQGTIIAFPNVFRFDRSLMLKAGNRIEILLAEATTQLRLKLTSLSDDVKISYYLGYPYTPAPAGQQGEEPGDISDSWDAVPESLGTPSGQALTLWAKLRLTPGVKRLLCYERSSVEIGYGPGRSIKDLLEKFALTNYYLRQMTNLPPAAEVDEPIITSVQFCARLNEVLQTLIVALTGKDEIHPLFLENVDHFYLELRGYIDEYRRTIEPDVEPDALANEFYEKWMGLIACLGELYDSYGSLPASVQTDLTYVAGPRIEALYRHALWLAGVGTGRLSLDLNPLTWAWDDRRRLLSLAGFFGVLSLDFAKIVGQGAETLLASYYQDLERMYFRAVRAMKRAGQKACGDIDCFRTKEMLGIMRTLCVVNPGTNPSPAVADIQALVNDFNGTILQLQGHLGWADSSAAGFCPTLRRALGPVIVAYSAYDALPFTLRYKVDRFYERLLVLVKQYREDIKGLTLPTLDSETEQADNFVSEWADMLGCLCALCDDSSRLDPVEQSTVLPYVQNQVGLEIEEFYATLIESQHDELMLSPDQPMGFSGNGIPSDERDQIEQLINLMIAFFVRCDADVQLRLELDYPAFKGAYNSLLGWMEDEGYVHCESQTADCYNWIDALQQYRLLLSRSREMPQAVRTYMDENISGILGAFFNDVFPAPPDLPPYADPLAWKLDLILENFRSICLSGGTLSSSYEDSMVTLGFELTSIRSLPGAAAIDALRSNPCYRRWQLVSFYEAMCMQNGAPLPTPGAGLIAVVTGFASTLNQITTLLGLKPISLLPIGLDFCGVFGQVIRAMVVAYGCRDRLSLTLLAAMETFCEDVQDIVNFSRPIQIGTCGETQKKWLDMLFCLCRITEHRGLFPDLDAQLSARMGAQLRRMSARAQLIAERMNFDILPSVIVDRWCERLRVIGNYIGVQGLDYSRIAALKLSVFTNHAAFKAKMASPVLDPLREKICFPVPGPYDPLVKQETRSREDLLKTIYYDDPSRPIDRIVIEPTGCTSGAVDSWYWAWLEGAALGQLAVSLGNDRAAMQALRDAEEVDSDEWLKYDDLMDEIADEMAKAAEFLEYLQDNDPPFGVFDACTTYIHEVCWLPPAVFDYNRGLPPFRFTKEVALDLEQSLKLMNQPIWRPNTAFAIQIQTNEKINNQSHVRYRTVGFKTAGPVGHFHAQGDPASPVYHPDYQRMLDAQREDEYKYKGLQPYIDFERSYPNADGNLVDAKPLYYSNTKLQIFYNHTHVQSMYSGWGWWENDPSGRVKYIHSALELVIADASETRSEEPPLTIVSNWRKDFNPRVPKELRAFRNIMANAPTAGKRCVSVTPEDEIQSRGTAVPLPPEMNLRPSTLYTASFVAAFGELAADPRPDTVDPVSDPAVFRREVYRYLFKTSRYGSFAEQIESYKLSASENAFYELVIDAGAAGDAEALIANWGLAQDPLAQRYAHNFELLMQGVLGISGLAPATTTEFHTIRQENKGKVLGVLMRSPEPFFDPKIPADALAGAITVAEFTTGTPSHRFVYSKDRTAVFVTNNQRTLGHLSGVHKLHITITPWEYDGRSYGPAKTFTKDNGTIATTTVPPVSVTIPIGWP